MKLNCPNCGVECSSEANFCGDCGTKLLRTCPSCEAENPLQSKFCSQCGIAIEPGAVDADIGGSQAERRQLTVMFCDVVGSTELSSVLDSEDYRNCLRLYQQEAAGIVEKYQGHIAQFLGDGLLVYFGYPQAQEDSAESSVRAGLDIIERMASLRDEFVRRFGTPLEVRIGIHTGTVIVGELGSSGRTEQLATGVTPNVAARLQSIAEIGRIALSENTWSLVQHAFEFEDLGNREIKGIGQPMHVRQVISLKRGDQITVAHQTPFVGRDQELQRILSAARRAESGAGQVVMIRGEAGIGKTRLRDELWSRLESDCSAWVRCACSGYHTRTPLYPVIDFIERWLGYPPRDQPEIVRKQLSTAVAGLPRSHPDLLAALEQLLSVGSPAEPWGGSHGRENLLQILVDFVIQLSSGGLAVIEFEDVHWADATSVELLERLIEASADQAVLILVTARPDFAPPWVELGALELVELDRLSKEAVTQLLSRWDIGGQLSASERHQVAQHTDGVPLFLEEFTKYVSQQEQNGDSDVPLSLSDSLTARLDGLGPARKTLQLAALLGREFSRELLVAVAGGSVLETNENLMQAVRSGLLIRLATDSARFSFKHALFQDAAYESLLHSERLQLHGNVADALQEAFPELVELHPETLARHLEGAQRYGEALEYYERAAQAGGERHAFAESVLEYEKSLEMLAHLPEGEERNQRELDLILALCTQTFALRGYTDPGLPALYERAQELVLPMKDRAREMAIIGNVWGFHCVRGDHDETIEMARRFRTAVGNRGSDIEMASVDYVAGVTSFYRGDFAAAVTGYRAAVDYIKDNRLHESAEGLRAPLFISWIQLPWALAIAGQPDEAHMELDKLQGIARDIGDPLRWSQTLTHSIAALQNTGAYDTHKMIDLTEQLTRVVQENELATEYLYAQIYRSWALGCAGDEGQIENLRDAITGLTSVGATVTRGRQLIMLAELLMDSGRLEEALETIDDSVEFGRSSLARFYLSKSLRIRGDILAAMGERQQALASFREALRIATSQGSQMFRIQAATAIADLHSGQAGEREAILDLRECYGSFKEGHETPHLIRAWETLERYSRAQG